MWVFAGLRHGHGFFVKIMVPVFFNILEFRVVNRWIWGFRVL